MGYGQIIRSNRNRLKMTQRELADRVGCTDGYVAHLESEVKLPSINLIVGLGDAFEFTIEEQQSLLDAVEAARVQRSNTRIRTRGAAEREIIRMRSASDGSGKREYEAERIAHDLDSDPELREAYRHLCKALSNPRMRETVLNALRAFAQSSQSR
jgi:transcriptional regulator with XRE-family HTH domain